MKAFLLATTVLAALSVPATAIAQDATASEQAEATEDQGLGEIVVTAQRREESLQRAAVAVARCRASSASRSSQSSNTRPPESSSARARTTSCSWSVMARDSSTPRRSLTVARQASSTRWQRRVAEPAPCARRAAPTVSNTLE